MFYCFDFLVFISISVPLSSDSSCTCLVQIESIIRVHSSMNSHVLNVIKIFMVLERIRALCHHFAHVISFHSHSLIGHKAFSKITSFLAPIDWRVPPIRKNEINEKSYQCILKIFHECMLCVKYLPFKCLLTSYVAHATFIKWVICETCRHF